MNQKNNILILLLFISFSCFSQNTIKDTLLPKNTKITYGTLENGLTYYIYPTDFVKNMASFYIIQNVGSILENDNQSGLAHFLEHMAFNGTNHFEGKSLLNTLEKHGAVFGRNINAYTGFEETVYNIDNIATDEEGLVDTCLLVLEDWADGLSLTETEIDAERAVIKEEWRSRQNGPYRVFQAMMPEMYNHSKFAERMPIGSMDIVENFEYKALRDFYKNWYRTDLQAIAIVGDVNVAALEAKIKERFSKIRAIEKPYIRTNMAIPDNKEPLFKLVLDQEISNSKISYFIKHANSLKDETVSDLEASMHRIIALNILGTRLSELSQKPDTPFLKASFSYKNLNRLTSQFSINIVPKPDKQVAAFESVLTEFMRAKKHGFTQSEIDRTITLVKSSYENYIDKEDEQSHNSIIRKIQANYLENKTMTDASGEFELVKQILEGVNSNILKSTLNELYTEENRVILVTGVINEHNIEKEEALKLIAATEQKDIEAYVDEFESKNLLENIVINEGAITKEIKHSEIEATTFVLSNGVKVHYKYANKNKNEVKLTAISDGGSSLYADSDQPSLTFTTIIASQSGLGQFSLTDLRKLLVGKRASVKAGISGLSESISGSALTKDIETLFQLTYLQFIAPRFDKEIYDIIITNQENSLKTRYNDIANLKRDSLTIALYGENNSKARIFNQKYIDEISFERLQEIYKERFNNISDFEFYIVGDIGEKDLKPLLEKYIASIKGIKRPEKWKDNSVAWKKNVIDKDIFIEMNTPQASVNIQFKNNFKYSVKNSILTALLGDVLQLRYTETLRENEGGTYGASVEANMYEKPNETVQLSIGFGCDPAKAESLIPIVYQEIEKIKNGAILQDDIDKTIKNYLKSRVENKNYNQYYYSQLYVFITKGYNIDDAKNYEDILNGITKKDLQKFSNNFFGKKVKSYEIVFKPNNVN